MREGEDGTAEQIMKRAAASGTDMSVRGAGHSCNTQTLSPGMVLDNLHEGAAPRFTGQDDLVDVPSGVTWLALERWLHQHGRANPVLPSYLNLTVGGTLSIGGFGPGSLHCGLQVDQVVEIELIDGAGHSLHCSPRENSELFQYALGGLGQVGFIRRAVLRTVPHQAATPVSRVQHAGLSELTGFMKQVTKDPGIRGYFGMYDRASWYSQVSYASQTGGTETGGTGLAGQAQLVPDLPLRLHEEVDQHLLPLLDDESRANIWADYVLDEAGLDDITGLLEEVIHEPPLAQTLISLYFLVIQRPQPATPFVFAPTLDAPVQYGVGVFTSVDSSDSRALAGTKKVQRQLLSACAKAKGRPYLYGSHEFDAGLLEGFYGGAALRRLEELREQHSLTRFNRRAFGGPRP